MSILRDRKLKIWSSAPNGGVYVWQDSSAVDADADEQYDDGFRSPGDGTLAPELIELRSSWSDFPSFTFSLMDGIADVYGGVGAYAKVQVNDKVEFWAEVPDVPATIAGDLPDWHVLEETASTQVRLFYGWVQSVSPTRADGKITVECYGALERANEIKLWRDNAQGIEVPAIAFNVRDFNSKEFYYSVKKRNQAGVKQPGLPYTATDADIGMSIKDILEYLEGEYGSDLAAASITASSTIWESADISGLTQVPPEMVLRDMGFYTGVQQVLKYAPDVRLIHDPRALKFRIVPVAASLTNNTTTLTGSSSALGGETTLPVADTSIFSATPGAPGNRIRIQYDGAPDQWELSTVASIGASWIKASAELGQYVIGDTVSVVHENALPTVLTSTEDVAQGSLNPRFDLNDTYTAVRIVSHSQKTSTRTGTWGPQIVSGGLEKGWNSSFESSWRREDERREIDNGAEGDGIPVYTEDTGGTGGQVRLYIAYEDTAFDDDHVDDEWNGCSVQILTLNNSNARNDKISFEIVDSTTTSDIGDGRPGLILEIGSTDLDGDAGDTFIVGTDGGTADKIALSSRWDLPTTVANNGRNMVGRAFVFSDETVSISGPGTHTLTCHSPQVVANDCTLDARSQTGYSPSGGVPGTNGQQGQQWETLLGGGLGSTHVWRRSFTVPKAVACPGAGSCGGTGYLPPKSVEATIEVTTTTVRQARYPSSGHGGHANLALGLERELVISTEAWEFDHQDDFFDTLAEAIWHAFSTVHYTGSLELIGIKEWGGLIDLGTRLSIQHTMGPAGGAGDYLRSAWALPVEVTLDFAADKVRIDMDNRAPFASFIGAVTEDLSVNGKLRAINSQRAAEEALQLGQCALNANRNPSVSNVCAGDVLAGGRPITPQIKITGKDNQGSGLNPNDVTGSSTGRGGGTHGPRADSTVFEDLAGNPFEVTYSGSIMPGTVTSGAFTANPNLSPYPETTTDQVSKMARGALALFGLTPVEDLRPVFTEIASTATGATTVFTVAHKWFATNALVGGRIIPNTFDTENPRGVGYTITANNGSSITVAAISEDDPADGSPATIVPPRAPRPDATDFPDGGLVVQNEGGDYAVIDYANDEITPGTLVSGYVEASGTSFGMRTGIPPASSTVVTAESAIPRPLKTQSVANGATDLTAMDELVLVDTSSGSASILLPFVSDVEAGHQIVFKDIGGAADVDAITISAQSGDSIDGESAAALTMAGESVTIVASASKIWHEISRLAGPGEALKEVVLSATDSWNPVCNDAYNHWHGGTQSYEIDTQLYVAGAVDAATKSIGFQMMGIPSWYVAYSGSQDAVVQIKFYPIAAPSAGDSVVFRVRRAILDDGDDLSATSWTNEDTTVDIESLGAYELHTATVNTGSGWATAGKLVKFLIQRRGTDGADDYTGEIKVLQMTVISGRIS